MHRKFPEILLFQLIVAGAVVAAFILNSCHCSCGSADITDVPLSVLKKADSFIIAKTGKDYFQKYISPDFAETKFNGKQYDLVYRLYIPDKPYVNCPIKFTVDEQGNVDTTKEITGIPDCANNKEACDFKINEAQAVQIAKENKLPAGITKWKTGFLWNKELNRYVWHVLSTFSESGKGTAYKGSGREILVDPVTGSVIKAYDWRIP